MTRSSQSRRGSTRRNSSWDRESKEDLLRLELRCQTYQIADDLDEVAEPAAHRSNGSAKRRRRAQLAGLRTVPMEVALAAPPPCEAEDGREAEDERELFEDLGSDAGSESGWSVVTSAETSWVVLESCSLDGDAPWPDTSIDDAMAQALQEEERGWVMSMLDRRGWVASFPVARRISGRAASPRVSWKTGAGLEERLGVCVVCSESVATVVLEPCGHLAMCGGCHGAWSSMTNTCALCRTPGVGIHLLRGKIDEGWGCPAVYGVNVRLVDGVVSVPSLDDQPSCHRPTVDNANLKLLQRRQMRVLTCEAKARTRKDFGRVLPGGRSVGAGGRYAKLAREAAAAHEWAAYAARVVEWKAQLRMAAQAKQAGESVASWASSSFGYYYTRKHQIRALARLAATPRPDVRVDRYISGRRRSYRCGCGSETSVSSKKADVLRVVAEAFRVRGEARRARIDRASEARAAAQAAAAAAADVASRPRKCLACGETEACMMALPCRCTTLCRACWDTGERTVCMRCGAACRLSLCVHRP